MVRIAPHKKKKNRNALREIEVHFIYFFWKFYINLHYTYLKKSQIKFTREDLQGWSGGASLLDGTPGRRGARGWSSGASLRGTALEDEDNCFWNKPTNL